jgi:uncharacterized protein (DUF427 family)
MGVRLGRAPLEPGLSERRVDVCKRRRRQSVDVIRKRTLVELISHDRRNAGGAQDVRWIPDAAPHDREWVDPLLVDIARQERSHLGHQLDPSSISRAPRRIENLRGWCAAAPLTDALGNTPLDPSCDHLVQRLRQGGSVCRKLGIVVHDGNAATVHPQRIEPGPGQESVWDYPRPPRLERTTSVLRVEFAGVTIAETTRGYRLLETSQPPAYYFPPDDIAMAHLFASPHRTFCEWKGQAHYYTVRVGDREGIDAAWAYAAPLDAFVDITGHLAFYPQRVDGCFVDGEQAQANDGAFYGGWITSKIVGPFKGGPGTADW